MTRDISNVVTLSFNKRLIDELYVGALEIYDDGNPDFEYIRIVNDNVNLEFETNTYNKFEFNLVLVTDSEDEAKAQVSISVVNKEVTDAIHNAQGRIRCRILLIRKSDSSAKYDTSSMLSMRNISGNQVNISATLGPVVSEDEPFPFMRAHQRWAPGLYL